MRPRDGDVWNLRAMRSWRRWVEVMSSTTRAWLQGFERAMECFEPSQPRIRKVGRPENMP